MTLSYGVGPGIPIVKSLVSILSSEIQMKNDIGKGI
jgi:hypothetical protein